MGPEVTAAVGAAEKAVEKAVGSSKDEKKALLELAKETPEMHDAAVLYARRTQIRQAILLKLYQPIAKLLGFQKEYFDSTFAQDLAQKTADIPEDRLISPSPTVALPAMQGLGYSLQEAALKEMYLNLLRTASDAETADDAHPGFADVIRQLSPEEAGVLIGTMRRESTGIVQVRTPVADGYNIIANNITPFRRLDTQSRISSSKTGLWLDNWQRLGLANLMWDTHLTEEFNYRWENVHPEVVALREQAANAEPPTAPIVFRGVLQRTAFGAAFVRAAMPPGGVVVDENGAPIGHAAAWIDLADNP